MSYRNRYEFLRRSRPTGLLHSRPTTACARVKVQPSLSGRAYVLSRHRCDVTVLCAALSGGETTRNMGHDKSIIRTHEIGSSK